MSARFAPSGYQMEQAMTALLSARVRLLEQDPELAADESALADILGSDPDTCDAMDVLDRVLRAEVHARAMQEAADARVTDLELRRDRYKRRAEELRRVAFSAMDALGIRKRELPDLTASVAAGRMSVVITDEKAVPARFLRTKTEPDRSGIGAALKAGDEVPGAMLGNGGPILQIRSR